MAPSSATVPCFKRILLKISGEALMGDHGHGIKPEVVAKICDDIKAARALGVDVALVVGGGNIFRGVQNSTKLGMDRAAADYVGMTATILNALVLQGVLKNKGLETRMMTAIGMDRVAEPYIRLRAMRHLEKGRVVIFGAGTGNPYFTTDSAASLRAVEIQADLVLKGTRVDGIYTADPEKDTTATRYEQITFSEVYEKGLNVMDLTAITLCQENNLPIVVFDMNREGNFLRVCAGEGVGTLVS